MCPIHFMHVTMMIFAKQKLEEKDFAVVGGLISPSHDDYVQSKMSSKRVSSIKKFERIDMIRMILNSEIPGQDRDWNEPRWLFGSTWEIDQHWFIDFPEVYNYFRGELAKYDHNWNLFYVCGADHSTHVSIRNTVVLQRPGYGDGRRLKGWHIVEKDIDQDFSSSRVRALVLNIQRERDQDEKQKKENELKNLVGEEVKNYLLTKVFLSKI